MERSAQDLINRLRSATVDDVTEALHTSYVKEPRTQLELLEFFQRMLDAILPNDR